MKKLVVCIFFYLCFLYACFYPGEIIEGGFIVERSINGGMNTVSYYEATHASLKSINDALSKAGKKVNLDDTYRIVYGESLKEVGSSGNTGYKFKSMQDGTYLFQKLLKEKKLPDAGDYILTSINNAIPKGFILVAVVYRPHDTIKVVDKYDHGTVKTLTKADPGFYEPYRLDADGNSVDTVVDWAGVSMKIFSQQKNRAIMLTLAANKVFENAVNGDYWEAEQRWIAGQYGAICEEQDQKTCNMLGLRKDFIQQ